MNGNLNLALDLGRDLRRGDYSRIKGLDMARLAQAGADILAVFGESQVPVSLPHSGSIQKEGRAT